jgi:cysteine desulfurase
LKESSTRNRASYFNRKGLLKNGNLYVKTRLTLSDFTLNYLRGQLLQDRFCAGKIADAPNRLMPIYLDCNATTPIEPEVADEVIRLMTEDYGNAGSRTHEFGVRAKRAVQRARGQIAAVVQANPEEIIFTGGATESNNLAILGLRETGGGRNQRHVITSAIEHKAVLEPIEQMAQSGFDVTVLEPTGDGWIDPDTILVSLMHVNNETGVIQPISEIAGILEDHHTFFHVDASQGFGKEFTDLESKRIDLISLSGHKNYAPKGVGALVARRRGYERIPLTPLVYGGGQENGFRPGTLAVQLIVGLGLSAEIAQRDRSARRSACNEFRRIALDALMPLGPVFNGDPEKTVTHTLNISFHGIDSEALMLALKDEIAISNGSACTSHSYAPSHVLKAMRLPDEIIQSAVRISWCHMTEQPDWDGVVKKIKTLM